MTDAERQLLTHMSRQERWIYRALFGREAIPSNVKPAAVEWYRHDHKAKYKQASKANYYARIAKRRRQILINRKRKAA